MLPEEMVGQILGHYRIIRSLGYGGTATVFLAEDINLQREVALKVFQPGTGETQDFLHRFAREARILAQLDHPNILPVYDYGEQNNIAYLVMPHMAGGSLRDRLRKQRIIPAGETAQMISQVLNGLQYAHDRGLIHRDIKPGNMLFKADGTLLLSDFGVVKVVPIEGGLESRADTASITGQTITGTPEYMAPEQITGKAVPASDIYATGAVLYEMLTGQHLFNADNYLGILMKQLYEQPPLPHSLNPEISPELEEVVMHALEKDSTRRYQRPVDLQQALLKATIEERTQTVITDSATVATTWPTAHPQEFTPQTPALPAPPIAGYDTPGTPSGYRQPVSNTERQPPVQQPVSNPGSYPSSQQTPYYPLQQTASHDAPLPTRRRQTPLIVGITLIVLAILISVGSILYAKGSFTRQPNVGGTPTPKGGVTQVAPTGNGTPTKGGATPIPGGSPGAAVTTLPVPPTTTDCPAAGTARHAVIAWLALGSHQNVIYIVNEGTFDNPTFGTVKRHDITTGTSIEINKTPNVYIRDAQVSQDGQWVLFTAKVAGQYQLRLVRVDGQGLQTLYCAPSGSDISSAQWSFDQKMVIFDVGPYKPTTYLLDMASGKLQAELVPQANLGFIPRTWLDDARVYMTGMVPNADAPPQNIYILDTRKGANQHDGDLQTVVTASLACTNFDSSYSGSQIFISTCTNSNVGLGAPTGPSTITAQPATGGAAQQVYTNPVRAVTAVRAVAPTTLLLTI
ncbi:MAG: protein kinase, partial [Chloroflexi bacterium]|nr:protein kinase [Chloroflexota bacterium]